MSRPPAFCSPPRSPAPPTLDPPPATASGRRLGRRRDRPRDRVPGAHATLRHYRRAPGPPGRAARAALRRLVGGSLRRLRPADDGPERSRPQRPGPGAGGVVPHRRGRVARGQPPLRAPPRPRDARDDRAVSRAAAPLRTPRRVAGRRGRDALDAARDGLGAAELRRPRVRTGDVRAVTAFPHPYPQLAGLRKETIEYTRADGVPLSATLYLPPGYDAQRDGPLPTLVWAYPAEFKSASAAGQRSARQTSLRP